MGRSMPVCVSTLCSLAEGSAQSAPVPGVQSVAGGASVGCAAMVSAPAPSSGSMSSSITGPSGAPHLTPGSSSSHGSGRSSPTSRLAHLSRSYAAAGLSSGTIALILGSWRDSTNSAYSSAWTAWHSWCSERRIDSFQPPASQVLQFLTDMFAVGRSYRTLNVYRSALSSTLPGLHGASVGQHPLVVRLMRGVFQQRPPQPRYSHTWKVSDVLGWMDGLGDNSTLSLRLLSIRKLALLMALTGAKRSSDLHRLDFHSHVTEGDGSLRVTYASMPKQRRPGCRGDASLPTVVWPVFDSTPHLCVSSCFQEYVRRTAPHRQTAHPQIFLSLRQPFKPVTSSSIARWIKDGMTAAGVDTAIFSAHSLRGAATSAAHAGGVSLADILHQADWSSASTFRRFYLLPVDASPARTAADQFTATVLRRT
eukprot:scpid34170/ scgid7047/ 